MALSTRRLGAGEEWRVARGEGRVASGEGRGASGEWRVASGEGLVASGSVSYTHLRAHETNDLISYAVLWG